MRDLHQSIFSKINKLLVPGCISEEGSLYGQWNPKLIKITSWLIIFVLMYWGYLIAELMLNPPMTSYWYTEFLINYSGGFVRRGLLGQILLYLNKNLNISPLLLINIISIGAYLCVTYFFLKRFIKRGYCWWFVFSPLFCGYLYDIIRKDYLLAGILIIMLMLVMASKKSHLKFLCAAIIGAIGLTIHEAFFFWGIPIVILQAFNQKRYRIDAILSAILFIGVFLIMCLFKGDESYIPAIVNSWYPQLTINPMQCGAISALGWDSIATFKMHLTGNYIQTELSLITVFFRLFYYIVIYYFIINFNRCFSPKKFTTSDSNAVAFVYVFATVCMIPMFTILSCDFGRNYLYLTIVTFSSLLISDARNINTLFPKWYKHILERFNRWLNAFIPPSKGLLWLLLFILVVTPAGFIPRDAIYNSLMGKIFECITQFIRFIILEML